MKRKSKDPERYRWALSGIFCSFK